MKKAYVCPKAEKIDLRVSQVLAPSGENVILDESKNQSGSPAEEFGGITLF